MKRLPLFYKCFLSICQFAIFSIFWHFFFDDLVMWNLILILFAPFHFLYIRSQFLALWANSYNFQMELSILDHCGASHWEKWVFHNLQARKEEGLHEFYTHSCFLCYGHYWEKVRFTGYPTTHRNLLSFRICDLPQPCYLFKHSSKTHSLYIVFIYISFVLYYLLMFSITSFKLTSKVARKIFISIFQWHGRCTEE